MTLNTIANPSIGPSSNYPIQLNRGPDFYQNELSNSFIDYKHSGRPSTRFLSRGKVYELRNASSSDISNIALRDGQMDSLIICADGLVRKIIADTERPHIPIGFYVGRKHPEHAQTLEMFYHYVSPKYRGNGIGAVQRADLLLLATAMPQFDKLLSAKKSRSNFYESLEGISSVLKKFGMFFYEVDLSDKAKAKKIIQERLKELGIEAIQ